MRLPPGVSGAPPHMNFFCLSERVSVRRHRSIFVENRGRHIAGDPELTEDQGDGDGQEGELDVRVAAPLHSSVGRRFRVWEDVAVDFPADLARKKKMSSGRPSPLNDDPVDVHAGGAGDDEAADGCKVHVRGVDGTGRGKADKGGARGLVKGKKAVGVGVVPPPAK